MWTTYPIWWTYIFKELREIYWKFDALHSLLFCIVTYDVRPSKGEMIQLSHYTILSVCITIILRSRYSMYSDINFVYTNVFLHVRVLPVSYYIRTKCYRIHIFYERKLSYQHIYILYLRSHLLSLFNLYEEII